MFPNFEIFTLMEKTDSITSDSTDNNALLGVRAFIGKKVNVDISCYSFGFCYPDENILVDVTDAEYIFKSDEIDSEDHLWRFPIKDKNCSCVVSLASPITFCSLTQWGLLTTALN